MTSLSEVHIDINKLSDSTSYLTRDQGNELKRIILEKIKDGTNVIIDLTNAEALSPSFADELFGGLETSLGTAFKQKVKIVCPKTEWKRLISSALTHRKGQVKGNDN